MTRPSGEHYELSMDEIQKIGNALEPRMTATSRKDLETHLAVQTQELKTAIGEHEKHITSSLVRHEDVDKTAFDRIDRRLSHGDSRMDAIQSDVGQIKNRIAYFGGALAVIGMITPFVVEFVKAKMK